MSEDFNYLSSINNVKIISYTSQANSCQASNILNSENSSIWLTETGLPQSLKIDLTHAEKRPTLYKTFGIYCWHAYNTNPKIIEIYFSKDNMTYVLCGKFNVSLKIGCQFFNFNNPIDAKKNKYMKILIKETFGGTKTYLNQVFLYDDIVENDKKLTNESVNLLTNENKTDEDNLDTEPIHPINTTESDKDIKIKNDPPKKIKSFYVSNNFKKMKNLIESNNTNTVVANNIYKERRESYDNSSYNNKNDIRIKSVNEDEKIIEGRFSTPNNDHLKSMLKYNSKELMSHKNDEGKNYKTLDDQLKEMENNLIRLKIDQKYEKRAMTSIDKEKNSFYSDLNINKGKSNQNMSNHLTNLMDNSIQETKKQNNSNINFNLPLSHHVSRNDYNVNNHIDLTNQNKISAIEEKLNKLENDILNLSVNFEKLLENVTKLVEFKNNFTEQNMNFILTECKKYINSSISAEQMNKKVLQTISKNTLDTEQNKPFKKNDNEDTCNESFKKKPPKPNKYSLEREITLLLDEKMEKIATSIEQRVYNSLLKPTINSMERNFSTSIEDIKNRINQMNETFNQSKLIKTIDTTRSNNQNSQEERIFSCNNTRNRNKNDNIHTVAEKLHEKLNEKERKLNKLQMQTNLYLKEKKIFSPKSYFD